MMSAFCNRSLRKASVQASAATSSTVLPGSAAAKRWAMDSPVTPPAQPRPKTGTRRTSRLNPMLRKACASSVGVAIPVEETVTMVSIRSAVSPASDRAARAALMNISVAEVM